MQEAQQQVQARMREMTWDEFASEFRPFIDMENETFMMFTRNEWGQLKERSNTHPGTVWTLMDDGEGGTFIGDGLHYVNALHWHITEVPAEPGVTYIVDHDRGSDEEPAWDDDPEGHAASEREHLGDPDKKTGIYHEDAYPMEVSLDGGLTWQKAPEGVRIAYKGVHVDGEDGRGEVHINCTHQGLITDIWSGQEENVGTDCVMIDDIVSRLVNEND